MDEAVDDQAVVVCERVGAVAHLQLNRPNKLNAANYELQRDFNRVLAAASADDGVGAIVVSGRGRAFSAGGDRTIVEQFTSGQPPAYQHELAQFTEQQMRLMLDQVAQPIVAALHGFAIGWGAGLIALSDYVVMEDDSFIQDPHAPLGMNATPACSRVWSSFVPLPILKDILMTGRRVDAAEAARLGIVNRVVAPGRALAVALEVAVALGDLPHEAVRGVKRSVHGDAGLLTDRGALS